MSVSYVPGGSGGGGGGGDASAANQVTGNTLLTSIDTKVGYDNVPFWPSYSGTSAVGQHLTGIDPGGALVTRGAVLTDEGTFRVNFANTSLAVSVGTVSISGNIVTGTGFLSSDIHYKDYFKLDADGETAWIGVETIDSDTQLTLRLPYTGGTSGAASRTLLRPETGAGGSIAVASGQAVLTTGTTANATTRLVRDMDYAPLIYRGRVSISQRIVNQSFRIGLTEVYTTADRWFARFLVDGTVNTTVICQSARNPTTTPSVAETETTTVTVPNGLTTASLLDYRVEQLTESCRFYINGVLVAEHSRSVPSQYDEMEASVGCFNGAVAPASTTTVTIDYLTGKNHNKLEMGIFSDTEKIVSSQAPLQEFTYNVTGVIAINTVLTQIDCSQLRSLYIQCTSIGTSGVVTPEWSNNGLLWVAATLISESGASGTTFNAAALRATNVRAKYFRLRMSTATSAGTTTIITEASQMDASPIIATQPISGTVTATVANATVLPAVPATPYFLNSAATTNGGLIITGTSNMSAFYATNEGATPAYIKLYNKATAPTVGTDVPEMIIPVPAAVAGVPGVANPDTGFYGFRFALGLGIAITRNAIFSDTTAIGASEVKVKLSRAI